MNPYEVRKEKGVNLVYVLYERLGVPKDLVKLVYKFMSLNFKPWTVPIGDYCLIQETSRWRWRLINMPMKMCHVCFGPMNWDASRCMWDDHVAITYLHYLPIHMEHELNLS